MSDADKRTKAIEQINGALARVEAARSRVNKARSELGTAEKQLVDAACEYGRLRTALEKLMPNVPSITGERAEWNESNEIAESIANGCAS